MKSAGDLTLDELQVEVIPSGFPLFDRNYVFRKGYPDIVVLAAGTSHGKSAILLQLAANVSSQGPVLLFSFEMDERSMTRRLVANRAGIPMSKIKTQNFDLKAAYQALKGTKNLHFEFLGKRQIGAVQAACSSMAKAVGKPVLIVVDYVQQLKGGGFNQIKTYEIGGVMAELKAMAQVFKCPVLCGAQLNREASKRGKEQSVKTGAGNYMPIITDIRDSDTISHDADVVIFLNRQFLHDRTRPGEADIRIAKNRDGNLEEAIFQFDGDTGTFTELEKA